MFVRPKSRARAMDGPKRSTRPSFAMLNEGSGIRDFPSSSTCPSRWRSSGPKSSADTSILCCKPTAPSATTAITTASFSSSRSKAGPIASADALRANLDATLRLIDPENPSHSVLLSSTLRPHGRGTKPRPIFPGSNDKAYKALAEWAGRLVAPKDGAAAGRS